MLGLLDHILNNSHVTIFNHEIKFDLVQLPQYSEENNQINNEENTENNNEECKENINETSYNVQEKQKKKRNKDMNNSDSDNSHIEYE